MKNYKRSPIVSFITAVALVLSLCVGILATGGAHAQSAKPGNETKNPAIARYAQDLTKLARGGAFDLVDGNKSAVEPAIQILSRGKQNNPVLIAEDGSESKTVVQELARRIATGEVPESLRQTRLYSLNLNALLDGVTAPGEIEARVKTVLSELEAIDGNSILFVDQLHQFLGQHADQIVSETMTEAAVSGKVRLIGATSSAAYEQYIAGNEVLDGLFKQVNLADDLSSSDQNDN
jgi:ATP-dependent Clp protease ATP-binding subunit ClpB